MEVLKEISEISEGKLEVLLVPGKDLEKFSRKSQNEYFFRNKKFGG